MKYALGFYENWISFYQNTLACLKIKLEYIFVAHGADIDNKKVHFKEFFFFLLLIFKKFDRICYADIYWQNLNHRMLHEVHHMVAERYLLKMFNPKTHKEYGYPFKALDEQVRKFC